MTENKSKYRLQDEDGIIQFETLEGALETIGMDPGKLAFIVDNANGQVVTVWMKGPAGVWMYHTSPQYGDVIRFAQENMDQKLSEEERLIPRNYREEVVALITGRGGEKIYEQLVEKVWDYIADNCSYPMDGNDEDAVAEAMQDYAFGVFKKTYLSDKESI